MWEEGFSDVGRDQLKAGLIACLRSHTFKAIPTIGDIRQHLQKAEGNAVEAQAALKWDRVLDYAVRRSPDIPEKNPPRFSEQTNRAINAAGGLDWIRDCSRGALVWARKAFIEAFIRYAELEQNRYLLPPGEVRSLLAECAAANSVGCLLEASKIVEPTPVPQPSKILASGPIPTSVVESVRVVDVEGRRKDLLAQSELIKAKYPATGKEAAVQVRVENLHTNEKFFSLAKSVGTR
jgi:hypothetical protein